MFNLEQKIAEWRRQMLAARIKTPAHLNELEGHLREEFLTQTRLGIEAEQAFATALQRLGQPKALKEEFNKTTAMRKARERRRAGYASAGVYIFSAVVITSRLLMHDLTTGERLSGFASIATTLLGVWLVWQVLPRFLPVVMSKTAQSVIGIGGGISGVVWMMAFAWLILPKCDFNSGQLFVAMCWALVPMLVLPAIGFMIIDKSERSELALP